MAARIDGIPEQIEAALERADRSPWPSPARAPSLLAAGAMGGSAAAAECTAALFADRMPRPFLVVRDYRWPACVDRDALALLASYSGNTEETLALYEEAGSRGAARAAITSGGALAEACRRDDVAWTAVPGGSPPRAALFSAWVPVTTLVHALGWCEDPRPAWRAAAARLRSLRERWGPTVEESRNPIKQLARALSGRLVFVYAGSGASAPIATRLRHQLNENAKLLGHSALVPELNHNEIVGWERPSTIHRSVAVVLLADPEEPAATARRLTLTAEFAARAGAEVHRVDPPEGGRLERMAAGVLFADYLSLYLALIGGVDPTPVASIDEFKRRLAAAGAQREP